MKFATGVAEWIWPGVSLNWINTEFKKNINNEINFLYEAENAQKIKKLFEGDDKIVIPKVKKYENTYNFYI